MTVLSCSCSCPENTESFHSFDMCPTLLLQHTKKTLQDQENWQERPEREQRAGWHSCRTHTAQGTGQAALLSLVNSSKGGGRHREVMGGHRHSLIMLHLQKVQHTMLERWEPRETVMFILNACIPPKEILLQTFLPIVKSLISYLSFLKQSNYFGNFSTILKFYRRGPKR